LEKNTIYLKFSIVCERTSPLSTIPEKRKTLRSYSGIVSTKKRKHSKNLLVEKEFDHVMDWIYSFIPKLHLIEGVYRGGLPLVSSMGAG